MPAIYTHTTRATGTVLTATIYNGDHQNHINNGDCTQLGGYSTNVTQMQTQVTPGGVGSESLSTIIGDELDRKSTRLNSSHIQKSRMPSSA